MTEPTYQERMRQKLTAAFAPILLEIKDDSARHAGHSGHNPGGETHFSILIVSASFEGKSRIERHRLIYEVLTNELKERVHALSLETLSSAEYNQR